MAIDTAERRKAAGSIAGHVYGLAPGVTPNATPDAEWRSEVGHAYPGILPAGPGGFTPIAGELNTTLLIYLHNLYSITNPDLTPLLDRYLDADTLADKVVSFRELKVSTDVENR